MLFDRVLKYLHIYISNTYIGKISFINPTYFIGILYVKSIKKFKLLVVQLQVNCTNLHASFKQSIDMLLILCCTMRNLRTSLLIEIRQTGFQTQSTPNDRIPRLRIYVGNKDNSLRTVLVPGKLFTTIFDPRSSTREGTPRSLSPLPLPTYGSHIRFRPGII